MRLGLDIRGGVDDEQLAFGAQLGATDAIGGDACMPSDSGYFEFLELVVFRQRVESAGLRLFAIENMPWEWTDKIKLGLPGRDEQIDNFCKSLRNMGAAGIPAIGYNFRPPTVTGVRRSHLSERSRTRRREADGLQLRPHQGPPFRGLRRGVRRADVGQPRVLSEGRSLRRRGCGRAHGSSPRRPARAVYRRRGAHPQ